MLIKKALGRCAAVVVLASSPFFVGSGFADDGVEERIESLEQELSELRSVMDRQSTSGSSTSIGGYGEINYNNHENDSKRDEFDVQRFILFVGHQFSDRTRMMSEIEFEHAQVKGGESGGEVAMEQAYIEHSLKPGLNLRAGLQIVPIGLINEYHEPPVFWGTERNEIETRIIPSTWREIGFSLNGKTMTGLEYFGGISTTPDASKFKSTSASKGFKDMRVSGKQVTANDMGFYAGFNYTGILGLKFGGTVWSGNTGQDGQGKGDNKAELDGFDATLTIYEGHFSWEANDFEFNGIYAKGSLGDTEAINASAGLSAGSNAAAPESFSGWYLEAAYHMFRDGDTSIAPFVRYADYNTQEEVAPGFTINPDNDDSATTIGVNWYVHPDVVFKIDHQSYDTNTDQDRTNVGIGWMF